MTRSVRYLDLADLLLIAEAIFEVDAATLALQCDLTLADSALAAPRAGFGEVEFHPEFATKAAVLCWHIVRNHAFIDGNKRIGYVAMREFVERNDYSWTPPAGDVDTGGEETTTMIEAVAAGTVTADELIDWVRDRLGQ
jgi:death-on-curing protein